MFKSKIYLQIFPVKMFLFREKADLRLGKKGWEEAKVSALAEVQPG
jgi:hypothetical protein